MTNSTSVFALAIVAIFTSLAHADQGSITNVGTTTTPAGTLTIAGSSLTYFSAHGTTAINATFTTSSSNESCSGGGKGGHITCYITFTGNFSGTLTVNGAPQAINGATYQVQARRRHAQWNDSL